MLPCSLVNPAKGVRLVHHVQRCSMVDLVELLAVHRGLWLDSTS
jgi:hypothetical protein